MSDMMQVHEPRSVGDELAALPPGVQRQFVLAYLTEIVEQLPIEDDRLAIISAIGVLADVEVSEPGSNEDFAAWCKDFDARHAALTERLDGLLASVGVQPMQQGQSERASI